MMNVIELNPVVTGNIHIPLEKIFNGAKEDLDHEEPMMVIGWDTYGHVYFSSSYGNKPDLLYLLEVVKKQLME